MTAGRRLQAVRRPRASSQGRAQRHRKGHPKAAAMFLALNDYANNCKLNLVFFLGITAKTRSNCSTQPMRGLSVSAQDCSLLRR
jgi:hypothetical protein